MATSFAGFSTFCTISCVTLRQVLASPNEERLKHLPWQFRQGLKEQPVIVHFTRVNFHTHPYTAT